MKREKVGVLIAIISSMAIVLFMTSEAPSEAEWKTYQNGNWGYSVEYPGDWNVDTVLTNTGRPERVVKELIAFKNPVGMRVITVDIWTNESKSSLLDWFIKVQKRVLNEGVPLPDGANTVVAGLPAIEVENPQSQACDEIVTMFLAKEGQLVFRFTYSVCDEYNALPIYNHMLSTFKILN